MSSKWNRRVGYDQSLFIVVVELAGFGREEGLETFADAVVGRPGLGQRIHLACEHVLLAQLELEATVFLYLLLLAERVGGNGDGGLSWRALDHFWHYVHLFVLDLLRLAEVGMFEGFGSRDAFGWAFLEHAFEKVKSVGVKCFVLFSFEGDVAGSVLREDVVVGFSGEGTDSEQHEVEDESETEHVTDWFVFGFHVFDVDNFRGHVAGGAATHEEVLLGLREL